MLVAPRRRTRGGYVRTSILALGGWALATSVAATWPGLVSGVPGYVWPSVSVVAVGLAVLCARNLSYWCRALEQSLESLRENATCELPDCSDPLFSRLFDACLALARATGNRKRIGGLQDRASQETLDNLAAANLRWTGGFARCELPMLASEPMAEDGGLADPLGMRASVTAQLEAIKDAGGVLDGFRGGVVSAFFPPVPSAAIAACAAALACKRAAAGGPPIAVAVALVPAALGELVEGGLTALGPETELARQLTRSARTLGGAILVTGPVVSAAGKRFRSRRLGRFRQGWRKLELHELLGEAAEPDGPDEQLAVCYAEALTALERRDWNAASELFKKCLQLRPADGPSRVCLNFSQRFRNNPPPRSWDGTLVLGSEP
ncbi:MAG: hypothetical protein HY816_07235 [Candidatus Wallbacteria bacterium]|nr:hypothetical protein [Candidatus Wallbacteria bacterium]